MPIYRALWTLFIIISTFLVPSKDATTVLGPGYNVVYLKDEVDQPFIQ